MRPQAAAPTRPLAAARPAPNADGDDVRAQTLRIVTQYVDRLTFVPLTPTESLMTAGIIDSMFLLDLVAFLEDTFGISIEPDDVRADAFETLDRIVGFVIRKRAD
jgi:acyl carrier protein